MPRLIPFAYSVKNCKDTRIDKIGLLDDEDDMLLSREHGVDVCGRGVYDVSYDLRFTSRRVNAEDLVNRRSSIHIKHVVEDYAIFIDDWISSAVATVNK